MKDDTIRFAYLLQTVTDAKTGLIIMQRIVEDKTDRYQLAPAIDYIIDTYNVVPEYISSYDARKYSFPELMNSTLVFLPSSCSNRIAYKCGDFCP